MYYWMTKQEDAELRRRLKKELAAGRSGRRLADDMAATALLNTTGIELPAALTISTDHRGPVTLIAETIEWSYDDGRDSWYWWLRGYNICKTGAISSIDEAIRVSAGESFRVSRRMLSGEWSPVKYVVLEEAC